MPAAAGHHAEIARVQPRHQVTLPKGVRRDLVARAGDTLVFEKVGDGEWRVRRQARGLLELLDRIRSETVGDISLAEIRAGWHDDDRP